MERAGYIQRNRGHAIDRSGLVCETLLLDLRGRRYAIRIRELRSVVSGRDSAHVERIRQHWKQYLDGIAGTATCSRTGRALNIDLVSGERYTVSLDSLHAVLSGSRAYARLSGITPAGSPLSAVYERRSPQTNISAF